MLEIELKCMIDEETFERIKDYYTWDSAQTQENHYYHDTGGALKQTMTTFRIRMKNGIGKVQVKTHKNDNSPLQICEETEFPIEAVPDSISREDGKKYTGLDTGELIKLGFNSTLRHSLMWNADTEICLDKTEYFDITDYEIEVEYTGDLPNKLVDELKSLGVEFTNAATGKYTRFIRRFNEIMNNPCKLPH